MTADTLPAYANTPIRSWRPNTTYPSVFKPTPTALRFFLKAGYKVMAEITVADRRRGHEAEIKSAILLLERP